MALSTSTAKTCASCAYYLAAAPGAGPNSVAALTGECRAEPPISNYRWPRVGCGEWCGRWATPEQAIAREERKPKPIRTRAEAAALQVLGSTSGLSLNVPFSAHAHSTP